MKLDPRLATITMLLCVEDDCIAWFGVKCSSSSTVNMGTSRRSFLLPEGDVSKTSVVQSNCLVARQDCLPRGDRCCSPQLPQISLLTHFLDRSVLLMVLCVASGGVFILENPRTSWMFHHPRIRWLCRQIGVTSNAE